MHYGMLRAICKNRVIVFAFLTAYLAVSALAFGQVMSEDLKLLPGDGGADHEFGNAIALDNGIVAIGARHDNDNGTNSGSAYLFDAYTGQEIVKLVPNDGAAGDEFGFSIAIAGGIVAVGTPGKGDNGAGSGAAYLFSATTGDQLAKLLPADGADGDKFGNAIAIDAGVVAVSAMYEDGFAENGGAAYLFDATTGAQLAKLVPEETGNRNFGVSIAMDGGTVVVGARMHFDPGMGFTLGAAYLFDALTGNQLHRIESNNNTWTDFFGDAVDIDDGIVAVGAWAKSIYYDHSGAAYLFDANTGSQLAYLVPADGHDRDNFGISISIDNDIVAIGAHQDGDNGWVSGSAYLWDASSGTQIVKFLASDGAAFDYFGSSIAIDNGVVAVGAIGDEDNGADSGSAYLGAVMGGEGDLSIDTSVVGADQGGTVNFTLDADTANGNRNYLLLGSVTGTSPGTLLPGGLVTIPLNRDWFTDYILARLNTAVFSNFWGTLDAAGEATASLNAPPLQPVWIGKILHFAYALNNPWDYASSAVAIEVVP